MATQRWARIVNGLVADIVLFDPATRPDYDTTGMVQIDGITPEPVTGCTYTNGVFGPAPAVPLTVQNQQTLQSRATAALTANDTFRALASPTQAQTVAYVQTVAKELNALIRLALGLFDSTSGT